MRAVIQRVSEAKVAVSGEVIGQTGPGLLILVCAMAGDEDRQEVCTALAAKIAKLRIFKDDNDKMNRSLLDIGGGALVISQFTLAADTRSGNRPGFSSAAPPAVGEVLYERFVRALSDQGIAAETGKFGADMQVSLINDGPVTIWLEM